MTSTARGLVLAVAAVATLAAPGCGGPTTVANSPEHFEIGMLEEAGQLYLSAYNSKKKAPTSLKDMTTARSVFTNGYTAIEKGDSVVYWGVEPTPAEPDAPEVLGYNKDVPEKGGYVLLKNLTLKTMTPAEFQAAPKPSGPTSSAASASPKKA